MILTGKAKEDFKNWLLNETGHIYEEVISDFSLFQYALIIEWFDSVGIYIIVDYSHHVYWTSSVEDINLQFDKRLLFYENGYNTRQEATKQAILKANEIYNELPR